MPYIHIPTSRYPINEIDIRADFPDTSFPEPFAPPDGYACVFPSPVPGYNPVTQTYIEMAPVLTIKGHYEQQWGVVSRFAEYTDDEGVTHAVAEQEAAAMTADQAARTAALIVSITQATQARLDDFARTRNYDGILSACTYATSTVSKFKAEGQYCVDARDQTWATLYALMGEVEAGTRNVPASYDDIENHLPALTWPV